MIGKSLWADDAESAAEDVHEMFSCVLKGGRELKLFFERNGVVVEIAKKVVSEEMKAGVLHEEEEGEEEEEEEGRSECIRRRGRAGFVSWTGQSCCCRYGGEW